MVLSTIKGNHLWPIPTMSSSHQPFIIDFDLDFSIFFIFPWRKNCIFHMRLGFFVIFSYNFLLVIHSNTSGKAPFLNSFSQICKDFLVASTTQNLNMYLVKANHQKYSCSYMFYQEDCRFKVIQKSRIRETKHLSTNADSSTDTKKILLVRQNLPKKKIK